MTKSRLDQLWNNFRGRKVSNTPSEVPSDEVILSESALYKLIFATESDMVELQYREHPTNPDMMQLLGCSSTGQIITSVDIDKSITDVVYRTITQADIDNGIKADLNTPALELVYKGKTKIIPLSGTSLKGSTTNTIQTDIVQDTIKSNLLIDTGNNNISSVQLKTSNKGVYPKLNIDNSSSITLKETVDGLSAILHLVNSDIELKIQTISWEEYNALDNKNTSTLYMISNKPLMYFNGQAYGGEADMQVVDAKIAELNESIQEQLSEVSGGLKSVALEGDELVLVYMTAEGETTARIDLTKYIDVYKAGSNITITGNTISANVPVKSVGITQSGSNEIYLSLNEMSEAVPFPMAKQNSDGNYQCGIMSKEDKEKLDSIDTTKLITSDNIENYAPSFTELDGKADVDSVYTKEEVNTLGNQLKAIAEARLPIDSFNQWSETVATKEEVAAKANASDVYTKAEVDAAVAGVDVSAQLSNYLTKTEAEDTYLTEHQDISGKANVGDSYTKAESDAKYLTEHQSLADYAKKSELPPEYDDTVISGRVATLEAIDHSEFATKQELQNAISTLPTSEDLNTKVDKAEGKGLSTNDFTNEDKNKLDSIDIITLTQDAYDTLENKSTRTLYIVD